jgi:GDPmannose 4,6-dehydratase
MMLDGELEFHPSDIGIVVYTNKGKVPIEFDKQRFRSAEVPILLSNTKKTRNRLQGDA